MKRQLVKGHFVPFVFFNVISLIKLKRRNSLVSLPNYDQMKSSLVKEKSSMRHRRLWKKTTHPFPYRDIFAEKTN